MEMAPCKLCTERSTNLKDAGDEPSHECQGYGIRVASRAPVPAAVELVPVVRGELSEVAVESLERITNEWQAHFWCVLTGCSTGSRSSSRHLKMGSVVSLINLISWEVCCIDIGGQLGLEWGSDATKSVKFNSTEEFVVLDLICRNSSQAMFGITNEAKSSQFSTSGISSGSYLRIRFSASGPSWTSSGK